MADPLVRADAPADGDADFVAESYLAYVVPHATDGRLEQALEACAREGRSPQALIEETADRESLFFDETVNIYLILQTPYQSEPRLRSYLDRLALSLEAQVVNGTVAGRESAAPVVETIFSGAVADVAQPLAIVSDPEAGGEDDEEDADEESGDESDASETTQKRTRQKTEKTDAPPPRQTYFVWKRPVFMARPRARLNSPSVVFAATASLKPAPAVPPTAAATDNNNLLQPHTHSLADDSGYTGRLAAGYLRSREPCGLNLLDSFGGDPALAGVWPRLSAQRVSRVVPATASASALPRYQPRALRGLASLAVRIFPALHTRVRYARPNAVPTNPAVVAMLEVDFTPFFDCEAVLTGIALSLPSGTVTDLNSTANETGGGLALPLYCVARDHFTFLYRLTPLEYDVSRPLHHHQNPAQMPGAAATRDLDITITAKMLVDPGVCAPVLTMSWTTSLDFTLPVNPGFGTSLLPKSSSLKRAHRPSQLSIDGMSSFSAPSVSQPDALPSLDAAAAAAANAARSRETTIPDFGITVTFTAPPGEVYAGEEFTWKVFVVNRVGAVGSAVSGGSSGTPTIAGIPPSPHHAARKLALISVPKRRHNDVRVIRPPSTSGPRRHPDGSGGHQINDPVADAVLDENVVHAMQRSSLVDSTDVVCLSSADTRVGPLAPNACHEVELRFLALRAGVVGLEAIRVVDLGSQEHVDVRELPAMVIAKGRRV